MADAVEKISGVKDLKGREFKIPVDAEHKAAECGPHTACMCAEPHMHEFWAATLGFFTTFFSCFAPGALGIYYKKPPPDGLGLSKEVLTNGGAAAVSGTIIMRVLAGPMCDIFGARKTFAILLAVGLPGMLIFATAQSGEQFVIGRCIIGLSLATFVTCQVWCSQFFSKPIVGTVNATAGGWGNLGGGVTLLTMPFIMEAFLGMTGSNIGSSWRLCVIIPALMHVGTMIFVLLARDLPDGSYAELEAKGVKQKKAKGKTFGQLFVIGFSNTNALIMLITYGLCFGVELTMNNKLFPYFTDYYAMHPTVAGPFAACFGFMNLFARSWGGILSDFMNKKFRMRGRIWAMWVVQTIEGMFCLLMGLVTLGADGPDEPGFSDIIVQGIYENGGTTYLINSTVGELGKCSSDLVRSPATGLVDGVETTLPVAIDTLIMIKDPGSTCVHNQGTVALTVLMMILFSICVQMAEGLHYGIVPYISRPALGMCSGMVGAGGNLGALIGTRYIIGAKDLDFGFIKLGIVIMSLSLIMHAIYFPEEGGMLFPPGCGYDPQLIKPEEGAKGSDELDFSNIKSGTSTTEAKPAGDVPVAVVETA